MMLLPTPFLQSLEHAKGFDREAFEAVHASGGQVTSVRLHPCRHPDTESLGAMESIDWCPYGYYLAQRPSFTLDPLFHAGAYYVQEASSMFLWHILTQTAGPATEKKVLDLCAAPGGKSTLLASYFTGGLLVANEVIKARAAVLVENITKWGCSDVIVTNNDPSHFQALPGYFDLMVIDAPCSGSGLFRKDPNAIGEWSDDNVQLCSQRQQRILADALPALKDEGFLIYSTCSYSLEEDEMIADWLLVEMNMLPVTIPIPGNWGIVETTSARGAAGYRFYPDKVKGEGLYIAVFQKNAAVESIRIKQQSLQFPSRAEMHRINDFIPVPADYALFKQAEMVRAISQNWLAALQEIARCLYIKKAGTEIGSIKGKDVIPSHELALGFLPLDGFSSVDLDIDQALQYLRRKELKLNAPAGWTLTRYCGLPLGWIKVLPNRINNYYPAGWRILKE